jgi:hypothetical protein
VTVTGVLVAVPVVVPDVGLTESQFPQLVLLPRVTVAVKL